MRKLLALLLAFSLHLTAAGQVITVPANGDLQTALNGAQPGGTIVLPATATFSKNYILPVKTGEGFITITSSRCAELPAGRRVTLADAPLMARIETPNAMAAIYAPPGSHHWRLQCLEVTQGAALPADGYSYSLVHVGEGAASQKVAADTPHHIEIDRSIVRTRDDRTAAQRGVLLNAAHVRVTNSHISGIKWAGVEAQAIAGWNGQGPFLIENNYLEAAGINVLFGGANPASADLIPSDIVIRGNYLFKPLAWRIGDPAYAGTAWTVKNLLEFKNARRVLVEGNTLENSWAMSQTGWAVIVNIGSDSMPNVGDDITMRGNTFRNVANGINLRGMEQRDAAAKLHRFTFADNLIENVGAFSGEGKAFQLLYASEGVTFDHNTVRGRVTTAFIIDSVNAPEERNAEGVVLKPAVLRRNTHLGLVFTNNVVPFGEYGVFGDGGVTGVDAMNRDAADWKLAGNAFTGAPEWARGKLPTNFFPQTEADAAALVGTDGAKVGLRATPVVQPSPVPSPTPLPTPSPTPVPTPVPVQVQYEHRQETWPTSAANRLALLNRLGAEGWEWTGLNASPTFFKRVKR
jgi:hypothetical protein